MVQINRINDYISIGILDLALFEKLENIQKKREIETAGTQYLLKQLTGQNVLDLKYTEHGKPFLQDLNSYISISHSHDKLAIILNKKENTGIDIELLRDKVLGIKHKFCNQDESAEAGNDIRMLITLWAAKEALYKVYGLKGVDFRINLEAHNFHQSEFPGSIKINGECRTFILRKEIIENYIMVFVLNEIL